MTQLASLLVRWRWALLMTLPALAILAAQGHGRLGFSTDYRVYFSDVNPQLRAFEEMQKTYDKSDNLLIVLAPKTGKVFDRQALAAIEWVTQESWKTPYSIRVDSISNFQYTRASGDTIQVADLAKGVSFLSPDALRDIEKIALSEPQLVNRIVSEDGKVAAVNVIYQLPGKSPFENGEVVGFARNLDKQIQVRYPDLTVHLTGMAMYNNAFLEASMADAATLTPIMYGVIVVVGLLVLRSFVATACAVLIVYLAVSGAMGIAGWLDMSLTSLSASAPLIILAICVADAVHILAGVLRHMRHGRAKKEATALAVEESVPPILITSLMNATGFLALNFSEVPPFSDLGNIVAIGIGCAFVLSVFLLPAIISLAPLRPSHNGDQLAVAMGHVGDWVSSHSKQLLWVTIPLVIVLAGFATRNELNDQYIKWFSPATEFRQANDFTTRYLTGLYSIEYSLRTDKQSGIADTTFLRQVDAYVNWLRKQPEVIHVSSITDTFKRINRSLQGDDPASYRLPNNNEMAAQSLLLYEMSLPYGLDLNNQINVDKNATRVVATLRDVSTSEMLGLERRTLQWLKENAPDVSAKAASTTLMFAHIGERSIHSMLIGTLMAAFIISVFLIVAFRSWKMGLLSLIPNILPVVMAFGIWGVVVGQLGFSVAIVASMTLGIVVDDTVHFISAVLGGMRNLALSAREAIAHAFRTTGGALLATTVILAAGFLVLGTSSFALNREMGLVTALTLVMGLLMDFFLLPALIIRLLEEKHATKSTYGIARPTAGG